MKLGPDIPNCYYRVSVRALITNEACQVLMVRENGRDWDLPGGGLDWGEDPIDGLHRELTEEIGCSGEIEPLPILVTPWANVEERQHLLWLVYRVTVDESQITTTEHVSEYCFLNLMEHMQKDADNQTEWISPTNFKRDIQKILSQL